MNRNTQLRFIAKIMAMAVRNHMEDFHVKHLSDARMRELNPLIRSAIYTVLYCLDHQDKPWCREYLDFQMLLLPRYWEDPGLTGEARRMSRRVSPPPSRCAPCCGNPRKRWSRWSRSLRAALRK